ncbi:MAG: hypothetical protein IH940_12150 [Acidobacteria bacterium]|nr:hypothetical protein [Acidobacteriota bacterium]
MGEPTITPTSALVPISFRYALHYWPPDQPEPWEGNLCGGSLSYRVELVDSTWTVTGTEGSVSAWMA